jgi:hypothetical protein
MSSTKTKLKPGDIDAWERVRCLRHGDFIRLFRDRYYTRGWYHFPDDSGGRDDLWLLVLNTSLAAREPEKKMRHIIETWAPWMPPDERERYAKHVWGLDFYQRLMTARELGERLGVTNAERERLKLWQFKPIDMTDEQLAEQRRRKNNERRKAKRRTRAEYLASSLGKPWEAEGIARATWYRRRETSPDAIIVSKAESIPVSPPKGGRQIVGLQEGESSESQCNQRIEVGELERNASGSSDMRPYLSHSEIEKGESLQ